VWQSHGKSERAEIERHPRPRRDIDRHVPPSSGGWLDRPGGEGTIVGVKFVRPGRDTTRHHRRATSTDDHLRAGAAPYRSPDAGGAVEAVEAVAQFDRQLIIDAGGTVLGHPGQSAMKTCKRLRPGTVARIGPD
jgi:hypothetical protein